jgi:hypothetical protein
MLGQLHPPETVDAIRTEKIENDGEQREEEKEEEKEGERGGK